MLDRQRKQLVLAVLERPQPRFPQEMLDQIREALASLVLQVSNDDLDEEDHPEGDNNDSAR